MAKLKTKLKLNIEAGKANPAPPVGPALGQHGVPIMDFCNKFNEQTKDKEGIVPAEISIFEDGSFSFILKTPPTASLILKAIKVQKGSGEPNKEKVGEITKAQLEKIAQIKMPDLNAHTIDQAIKIVVGTAKNMGVKIEGEEDK